MTLSNAILKVQLHAMRWPEWNQILLFGDSANLAEMRCSNRLTVVVEESFCVG